MTDLAKRLHRCTAFRRLRRLEKATRSEACGSLFWIAAPAGEEALKDGISNRLHRNGERAHLRRHRREPEAALVTGIASNEEDRCDRWNVRRRNDKGSVVQVPIVCAGEDDYKHLRVDKERVPTDAELHDPPRVDAGGVDYESPDGKRPQVMQQQVHAVDAQPVLGEHHVLQPGSHELTCQPQLAVLSKGTTRRPRDFLGYGRHAHLWHIDRILPAGNPLEPLTAQLPSVN